MVAVNKTISIDRGYKHILKQIKEMESKPYVAVGYPESKNKKHDGAGGDMTVADIATVHEFGSPLRNIPPRPTLTNTADKFRKDISKRFEKAIGKIAGDKETVKGFLSKIGALMQGRTQKAITDLSSPALRKPRKDGSSNPLVDSGQMRQSVAFEVKD